MDFPETWKMIFCLRPVMRVLKYKPAFAECFRQGEIQLYIFLMVSSVATAAPRRSKSGLTVVLAGKNVCVIQEKLSLLEVSNG